MTNRAIVSTEAPNAPILLALYADHGLAAGRLELSPQAAVRLAADLLAVATPKLAGAVEEENSSSIALQQAGDGQSVPVRTLNSGPTQMMRHTSRRS